MKLNCCLLWIASAITLCGLIAGGPTQAQIVPDATLPVKSSVTPNGNTNIITGGSRAGSNLFHSFEQFSIPSGGIAYFNNAPNIQNIISRVTGQSASNIDGLIKANGTANLFLLNSNGIIFGPNASLNIGGSFLASTANSMKFADGTQFSATAPQATPLLTISVPIGLRFGPTPGEIRVQGIGHDVSSADYQPIMRGNSSARGLQVQPGKTLALVGGSVSLDGGILTAESGTVELGSVDQGVVSLNTTTYGWSLGYENVPAFKDISLFQSSLIDASGIGTGSIQIQGRRLQLSGGSLVLIQNQGPLSTGSIKVTASDSLQIEGFAPSKKLVSGIWSETLGLGDGAEILVSSPKLNIQFSGQIFTSTFGTAKAGDISLIVPNNLQIIGPSSNETGEGVLISSLSEGSGSSGNITLSTSQLNVINGGAILTANIVPYTSNVISGNSGNITINASNLVDVNGTTANLTSPSVISAATFSTGRAGDVTINTNDLRIRNGGRVDSSTATFGTAGSVIINAKNSVNVTGIAPGNNNPSLLTSAAVSLNPSLQELLKLPDAPSGGSGRVFIKTNQLNILDGAQVSVENDGFRNAGNIDIEAKSINLNNSGSIIATTASGEGGNIFLNVANQLSLDHNSLITATAGGRGTGGNITIDPQQTLVSNSSGIAVNSTGIGNAGQLKISSNNLILNNDGFLSANTNSGEGGNIFLNASNLQLRHSSLFTAAAQGSGNGGNITINTGTLAALENSPITADAYQGRGGNIQINAQGLFQTPDSPITASSKLGINGTVRINTLDVSRNLELAALPAIPVDYTKLIPPGCSANVGPRASKFVMTGSGGSPPSPSDSQEGEKVVDDFGTGASSARTSPTSNRTYNSDIENAIPSTQYEYHGGPLIEAQGWVTNSKGEVVLVANAPTYTPDVPWLKSPSCHAQ